jgi:5-formyltetrahydrofolate cyclo-ligase
MSKEALRGQILSLRNQLTLDDRILRSKNIQERLFGLEEYRKAKTVLFYVSTGSEVHTHDMIKTALRDKKVAVPVSNLEDLSIEPALIRSMDELKPSRIGILEPENPAFLPLDNIDLIVVPSIVFDQKGHRIGHGKGYYDRFLARFTRKIPMVGLAYDPQVVEEVPAEGHDIPVHFVVSEEKLYVRP